MTRVLGDSLATEKPVAFEFPIELEFRNVGFVEGGKPEYPDKNPRSRDENQQQTQRTYDAGFKNPTRATLVGSACLYHCAIPDPLKKKLVLTNLKKPYHLKHHVHGNPALC